MAESEIAMMRQLFDEADTDGSGTLSKAEMHSILVEGQAVNLSEEQFEKVCAQIDTDGDGVLSFEEFLKAMATDAEAFATGPSEEDVEMYRGFFEGADRDGSGALSKTELYQIICVEGRVKVSQADFDKEFAQVDTDGDGEIDFSEFLVALRAWQKA